MCDHQDLVFKQSITESIANHNQTLIKQPILDCVISITELRNNLSSLHNGKSPGPDGIFNEMLKAGTDKMLLCIMRLFNLIIHSETVPSQWSSGFIVPIFKGGDKEIPSNCRGISITSALGKLFTLIMNNRLYEVMIANNLIAPNQIGFMKGKRTSGHIFVLKCIIEEAKKRKKPIYACFVDLKKAFGTVWRIV